MTWIESINLVGWLTASLAAAPGALLGAELLAALLPARRARQPALRRPHTAILIPAHNESAMIAKTIAALVPQLQPHDRLVVVADNCTDDTARRAADAGAEVIERFDPVRRGKGYALDFGVRHLERNPPEIVIIVDADVTLRAGSIDALSRAAMESSRPAQAIYVLRPPEDAGVKDQISHLAFTVRNHIRALGLTRLAGACPLFGAGMAFPFQILARAPLASGNIVEDLALSLDLAAAGHVPVLCSQARVDGTLVAIKQDHSLAQRRRWEHGHLRTILHQAPRIFLSGLKRMSPRTMILALDVMIPPLSLLVMISALASALLLVGGLLGMSFAPALTLLGAQAVVGSLIVLSWRRFAECEKPLRLLMAIPSYVLHKFPLYVGFASCAEHTWRRAARPAAAPHKPVGRAKRAA